MSRSYCLISPATSTQKDWDIFHLKGDIHSFVSGTSSFLCDIGESRYKQNKIGYQISRIRNDVLTKVLAKKTPCTKWLFLVQKNVFLRNFLFQLFKDGILWVDAFRIRCFAWVVFAQEFFNAARSIFFVNISARFLNISNSSNFIPNFVLLISRLPDIAQKTACTRNEALDVTFQMKYVLVF